MKIIIFKYILTSFYLSKDKEKVKFVIAFLLWFEEMQFVLDL